ncbi:DUF1801 domain-containing protein [Bacteroidales bacterium]|nr:DUF1801 domain-containing protein [Bacteroidales bacterium]
MKYKAKNIVEYIAQLPEDRQEVVLKLQEVINDNLPKGFSEELNYGMPGWVVPLTIYPDGYHCEKGTPLPFINLASQKNFVALYHMGIYADNEVLQWFTAEFPKHCKRKLDMGKSCIRFKYMDDIPYDLIGELARKFTAEDWIKVYEGRVKK